MIASCMRCLLRGRCEEPNKVPTDACVVHQLDWPLGEKLAFLRERRTGWTEEQVAEVHRACEELRRREEEAERRCAGLMKGAPEPLDRILRLSGI
jgi:hypothetical protein